MKKNVDILKQNINFLTFYIWHSAFVILCKEFGHNICMLVVSQPLEALRSSVF